MLYNKVLPTYSVIFLQVLGYNKAILFVLVEILEFLKFYHTDVCISVDLAPYFLTQSFLKFLSSGGFGLRKFDGLVIYDISVSKRYRLVLISLPNNMKKGVKVDCVAGVAW